MQHIEIINYFKGIAANLKRIKHHDKNNPRFIVEFNDELANKWPNLKGYFMVLSMGAGRFNEQNPWFKDVRRVALELHGHCDSNEQLIKKIEVRDTLELLAKQIVARIIEDSEDFTTCPQFMQKFNPSTAIYEHFESVVPNFLTCVLSFDLVDANYLEIDESEWQQ